MIAFEISINGHRRCVAGLEEYGVVSATLCRARHDESAHRGACEELFLDVGGLATSSREFLKWLPHQPLSVGDEILFRIVDTPSADPPEERKPDDPTQVRQAKEDCVRRYAAELGWKILV
jgi:hypothetical protein